MSSNRRGKYTKQPYKSCYGAWACMKQRCYNEKSQGYYRYGARGITVCEEWHNFENFFKDMGPKPKGKSLDRIDNNGNYEPNNCKWSTVKEQNLNKSTTNYVTWDGKTLPITTWAEIIGISRITLSGRLRRGWSVEDTFTIKPFATGGRR